jgi:uncharacterized protein with NRDE domain
VFSLRPPAEYPLVFAANRDELHERPSAAATWWEDTPGIFGGRDLVAGGTWLAVDRRGRLAAVTNYREEIRAEYSRSRGELVRNYLAADVGAIDYLASLREHEFEYGPYNLILFDGDAVHFGSNRSRGRSLESGIHAVSNTRFDTPWPKVGYARSQLAASLKEPDPETPLFNFLTDDSYHGEDEDNDIATRIRSTVFINDARYGTRASTVVLLTGDGELRFRERRFGASGNPLGETAESFRVSAPRASD